MKFIKTPVKGMCDMLPQDMRLREYVMDMIKKSYSSYGFMHIETPVMEHIENLTSNQGGDNEKLIFKVLKRGESLNKALEKGDFQNIADNGLRYDLTLPLARYYAANGEKLPSPFKALQIGNVWRADNPQKGRFRQFVQCDIDVLGDDSNLCEIELIGATASMLCKIFEPVNVSGLTVHINDRRILKGACLSAGFGEDDIASVLVSLDKFDKIGFEGVKNELVANGCSEESAKKYLDAYQNQNSLEAFCSTIGDEYLPQSVTQGITQIIEGVKATVDGNVNIVFDPTLVRGMGYYTGTIFEVTLDGYGFSVAGGGRYDEMIGKFSGQNTPACGFSIGFERIITILKDMGFEPKDNRQKIAILVHKSADNAKKTEVFTKAKQLRDGGNIVSVFPMKKNINAQFLKLEQQGYNEFIKIYND